MSAALTGSLQHGITLEALEYADPLTIAGAIDAASGNAVSAPSVWDISITGSIAAASGDGVSLQAGGTVDNSGAISAASYGIFAATQTNRLDNGGSIYGGRAGALMVNATANLENLDTGTIDGGVYGVKFLGAGPVGNTVLNAGTIETQDSFGIRIGDATGSNAVGGVISGGSAGIYVGVQTTIVNDGLVGGHVGILVGGEDVTIVDAGTISASAGDAIYFSNAMTGLGASDALTLLPGAALDGIANGGYGANVVFAGTTAGTFGNVGREFTEFPTVSIAPGAEWEFSGTSTLSGNITFTNDGTLILGAEDSLTIDSRIDGDGIIELDATTFAIGNTVASGAIIDFHDGTSTLLLSNNRKFSGTVAGFGQGDTIELAGFQSGASMSGTLIGNVLTMVSEAGPTTITFASDPGVLDFVPVSEGNSGKTYEIVAPPCFRAGTFLLTPNGPRPVETLRKGDLLVTHGGAIRPIVWHGQRRIDCRKHPRPEMVWPILIARDAFGRGVPSRDLYLSPDHALYCDGNLIPAKFLINGVSVRQVAVQTVIYHHVELESHDVIWADTLPAETYLDCGNRYNFAGQERAVALFPEFGQPDWDAGRAFAPLVTRGTALTIVRARLHDRLEAQGFRCTENRFRLIVDGKPLSLTVSSSDRHVACLPAGASSAVFESPSSSPAETDPAAEDRRPLGIAIADVHLDGLRIPGTHPRYGAGFYSPERSGKRWFRWTGGTAHFDVSGTRELSFAVQAVSSRWQAVQGENRRQAV